MASTDAHSHALTCWGTVWYIGNIVAYHHCLLLAWVPADVQQSCNCRVCTGVNYTLLYFMCSHFVRVVFRPKTSFSSERVVTPTLMNNWKMAMNSYWCLIIAKCLSHWNRAFFIGGACFTHWVAPAIEVRISGTPGNARDLLPMILCYRKKHCWEVLMLTSTLKVTLNSIVLLLIVWNSHLDSTSLIL